MIMRFGSPLFAGTALLIASITAQTASAQLQDGSFERAGADNNGFCVENCQPGAWSVAGRAGFTTSGAYNQPAQDGRYFAFIQSIESTTGSITQSFTLNQGVYNLSFFDAGRGDSGAYFDNNNRYISYGGDVQYDVLFDGQSIYSGATTTAQPFTERNVAGIDVSTSGTHTLTFASNALPSGFSGNAGFDQVAFAAAAPEPATWSLMILGFGVVGGALRRQKRAAVGGGSRAGAA